MPEARIGTSGWVYPHWIGVFYPPDLPASRRLAFYAERFDTVEVNASFYRLPERSVFESWSRQTPARFLFAVKASRYLTHLKKLKEPREPLARLMERAAGLGTKLGPVLFQLPPNWPCRLERLDGLLEALRDWPQRRFAFEFRDASWLAPAVLTRLERAGAALCLPVGPGIPLEVRLTAPWTYVRMHCGRTGIGFSDDELDEWAERLRRFRAEGADLYVYFNNDPEGHAVRDALRLRERLAEG